MIFIITTTATHATIACPPAANDVLRHTSALYHDKAWYLELPHLNDFTTWLRNEGHTPIVNRHTPDIDNAPGRPQPQECRHCGQPGSWSKPPTQCPSCGNDWDPITPTEATQCGPSCQRCNLEP